MSNYIDIQRGFFPKVFSSIVLFLLYALNGWMFFFYTPSAEYVRVVDGLFGTLFIFQTAFWCIVAIMYSIYSFTSSHQQTFGEWFDD